MFVWLENKQSLDEFLFLRCNYPVLRDSRLCSIGPLASVQLCAIVEKKHFLPACNARPKTRLETVGDLIERHNERHSS